MKKLILIGIKDVQLALRDRGALVLMLLAPFLLTVGMALVTGRLSGTTITGLQEIPLIIVNQDEGLLGQALVDLFQSSDMADLVEPVIMDNVDTARQEVLDDKTSSVILIPKEFTDSVISQLNQSKSPPLIHVITNPAQPTSSGIIQTIVESFLQRVEIGRVGSIVTINQLLKNQLILPDPQALQKLAEEAGQAMAGNEGQANLITLNSTQAGEEAPPFDILAYMAPGMALMFLMYTVSYGGRTILVERSQGTLPRLLVSPTTSVQVLGGKILGIYLTGVVQILILILASTVLFQVKWGDSLAVLVLVLAAVFGATGWGMLLTAIARSPGQVASIGSALMLTFGILGGSFINTDALPQVVQWIGKVTPNAWGLEGFTLLALGGTLKDLGTPILALFVMGLVLFTSAVALFNRRSIIQR